MTKNWISKILMTWPRQWIEHQLKKTMKMETMALFNVTNYLIDNKKPLKISISMRTSERDSRYMPTRNWVQVKLNKISLTILQILDTDKKQKLCVTLELQFTRNMEISQVGKWSFEMIKRKLEPSLKLEFLWAPEEFNPQ